MKIFVTGANGYIGKALVKAGVFPLCFDVTKPIEIEKEIKEKKPDLILHLAAKSNVDWCEDKFNTATLHAVNVEGTHSVFHHATMNGVPCVLLSTGQIWKGGFWEREHRENDKFTPPVNQYGLSKLHAERVVMAIFNKENAKIVRSSYVFDGHRLAPKIGKLRAGEEIVEPTFIRRSFIYLEDFVSLLLQYCQRFKEMPQILHLAGSETVSWHEFSWELAYQYGYDTELVKSRRTEVKGLAPRPSNGGLDVRLAKSLGFRIPHYTEGIKRMRYEV